MAHKVLPVLPSEFPTYDFKKIRLARPISLMSNNESTFFIKLTTAEDHPLLIQTTKCTTKKGIVKSSKKYYIDIIFDNYSESIIKWFEGLEDYCKQVIVSGAGSESWFAEQPTMDDIDVLYVPIVKVARKTYFMTTTIKTDDAKDMPLVRIYNESYNDVPWGDIGASTQFNALLDIKGIRFSARKIFIEIETKQIMVLDDEKIFDTYLINSAKGGGGGGGGNRPAISSEPEPELGLDLVPESGHLASSSGGEGGAADSASSKASDLDTYNEMMANFTSAMSGGAAASMATASVADLGTAVGDGGDLEEVAFDASGVTETIEEPCNLEANKSAHFLEIYREVKQKLKDSKRGAILAYLAGKNIGNADIVEMQELNDEFDDEIDELDPLSM